MNGQLTIKQGHRILATAKNFTIEMRQDPIEASWMGKQIDYYIAGKKTATITASDAILKTNDLVKNLEYFRQDPRPLKFIFKIRKSHFEISGLSWLQSTSQYFDNILIDAKFLIQNSKTKFL